MKAYQKKYYEDHKDENRTKYSEEVNCTMCGKRVQRGWLQRHQKTSSCDKSTKNKVALNKIMNEMESRIIELIEKRYNLANIRSQNHEDS